jgi:RND family efflux transporter MFP subunit
MRIYTLLKGLNTLLKKAFFILILLLAALAYAGWNFMERERPQSEAEPESAPQSAIKVITNRVQFTENSRLFETIGTGRAKISADIYPAVEDEVQEIFFTAQEKVAKGDILLQLDDREEKLAVRAAQVTLRDAGALLKRYEEAVKEGAVPQSQVDTAKAEYDGAQVALEQARLDLENHQVKAPFEGYVGIPGVDIGDRIGPDTRITGLDQRETLFVDFEVPETLFAQLQKASEEKQSISLLTPSFAGMEFTGTISAIESRVDRARRTITTRVSIDNDQDRLRPGMSFSTKWNIPGERFATVPEISLQWAKEGSFIWLVRDGVAEKVMTQVISRKGGNVLLEGDIREGDQVVVEGLQRLRPGATVELLGNGGDGKANQ